MAQHKKSEIRQAILEGAFRLFSERGYTATTLTEIARTARISPGNIYIYFGSKIEILYSLYEPWLRDRIGQLEDELARIRSPRRRLRRLLVALWCDIPAEENGFLNNIMQAISSTTPADGYRSTLVRWIEERITAIVLDAVPPTRRARLRRARIAHVLIMAFDGFAIHRHLHPDRPPVDAATIDVFVGMLLGEPSATGGGKAAAATAAQRQPIAGRHPDSGHYSPR
jgi:AcrR family transcriptional regulator